MPFIRSLDTWKQDEKGISFAIKNPFEWKGDRLNNRFFRIRDRTEPGFMMTGKNAARDSRAAFCIRGKVIRPVYAAS